MSDYNYSAASEYPPGVAAAVSQRFEEKGGETEIVDGVKRFTCCGGAVGRFPQHDAFDCMAKMVAGQDDRYIP